MCGAWELPRFPEKWQDRFQYYDEIWVGSSFIADALAPSSPIPIIAIPPVLSALKRGSREAGRRLIQAKGKDFVFLFIFDFHSYFERKNPLAVIASFKAAFKRIKNVKLVIKCVNEQFKPQQFDQMVKQSKGFPISIIKGYWTAEQMRDLTEACDCYVSLHRAEGTGLTIADAMAIGKPLIATGWSGNTDFMNAFNSFLVRYKLVQLAENIGPYRPGETWAEPSIEHGAELMRFVHQNQDDANSRGIKRQKAELEANYSPKAIGELIRHRLSVIGTRRQYVETRTALLNGEIPHKHVAYEEVVLRVRDVVASCVPAGANVMVISKGDDRLMNIQGRNTSHFPQNADGIYAGYHPTDSAMAIAHLESRRSEGVEYLVLPNTAFWWLDHYADLKHHLENRYRVIAKDEACLIYHLRDKPAEPASAGSGDGATAAIYGSQARGCAGIAARACRWNCRGNSASRRTIQSCIATDRSPHRSSGQHAEPLEDAGFAYRQWKNAWPRCTCRSANRMAIEGSLIHACQPKQKTLARRLHDHHSLLSFACSNTDRILPPARTRRSILFARGRRASRWCKRRCGCANDRA